MLNKIRNFTAMNKKKSLPLFIGFLTGILLLPVFSGCSRTPKQQEGKPVQALILDDGQVSLFDGESLNGWNITNFGTEGPVQVSEGNIVIGMGDGCSGITWQGDFPVMNYEVQVTAKKVSGNDFFCGMTFPVDSSFISLIVGGWGGPVVGLSTIDGYDASDNETRVLKKFEHNQWYTIRLKVTPGKIEAWIDEEQIVDFSTENRQLSVRPEVELSKPFGICTWITTAALQQITLKELPD